MLLSLYILKKVKNLPSKKIKESYDKCDCKCTNAKEISSATKTLLIIISIVFLIIELVLIFFAIKIALYNTTGRERVVNIILAFIVPIPYILLNLIVNPKDIKNALKRPIRSYNVGNITSYNDDNTGDMELMEF